MESSCPVYMSWGFFFNPTESNGRICIYKHWIKWSTFNPDVHEPELKPMKQHLWHDQKVTPEPFRIWLCCHQSSAPTSLFLSAGYLLKQLCDKLEATASRSSRWLMMLLVGVTTRRCSDWQSITERFQQLTVASISPLNKFDVWTHVNGAVGSISWCWMQIVGIFFFSCHKLQLSWGIMTEKRHWLFSKATWEMLTGGLEYKAPCFLSRLLLMSMLPFTVQKPVWLVCLYFGTVNM